MCESRMIAVVNFLGIVVRVLAFFLGTNYYIVVPSEYLRRLGYVLSNLTKDILSENPQVERLAMMRVGMYKSEYLGDCKFKRSLVAVLEFDNYTAAECFANVFEEVSKYDPVGYYGPKLLRLSNSEDYPDSMLDVRYSFSSDCWSDESVKHLCPVRMWVTDETYMYWALIVVQQATCVLKHPVASDMAMLVRYCYDKMHGGEL